jgi:hypothetical protein
MIDDKERATGFYYVKYDTETHVFDLTPDSFTHTLSAWAMPGGLRYAGRDPASAGSFRIG